jgi:carbonic anhydrase
LRDWPIRAASGHERSERGRQRISVQRPLASPLTRRIEPIVKPTPAHFPVSRRAFIASGAAFCAATAARVRAAAPADTPVVSAPDARERLEDGNERFVSGKLSHPDLAVERRRAFATYQAPFATLLSCSDSRVPPELIFDQNLGDLFIVRVAGNVADTVGLATLEYGYSALNSKLIVVLGHEGCGAVKATVDALQTGVELPPHLNALEHAIAPAIAGIAKTGTLDDCVVANVRNQVARLSRSQPVLSKAVASGDLKIVGAEYTLASGKVRFLD